MIIEIDIDVGATTDTSRRFDSISSVSGSIIPSATTLSTTEYQSPRVSSFSRTNSTLSPFTRIDSSMSSLSIMPSPRLTSPDITTTVLSPALSSIVTTSKSDSTSVRIDNNIPLSNKNDNINKKNKKRKKVTYFSLTDSSYCLYLRNRKIEDNKSSIVSLSSIRRTAINHFESIKYKSAPSLPTMGSIRRSLCFVDPKQVTTSDLPVTHNGYNLDSRKLRRYIIEDVMYINPIEHVLLLICEDSDQFQYWKKIITEQNNGLETICFGSKVFRQINATVIKNVSRQGFINGEYDNDMIDYHVLGIGGAAVSIGVRTMLVPLLLN